MSTRPGITDWLHRVEKTPRFMNDLQPYPANARPGAGRGVHA
jgi:hypothetical protein